jgi:hypothetical protein
LDNNSYQSFLSHVGLTDEDMTAAVDSLPEVIAEEPSLYKLAPSPIHGQGAFATADIDGLIGKFRTEDGDWYTLGRYTNHSAAPNAKIELHNAELVVVGKVAEGEEILLDYFQVKELVGLQSCVQVVDDFSEGIDQARESAILAGFGTWAPNKGQVGSSLYEGMGFVGDHSLLLRALMYHTRAVVVPNSVFFRNTHVGHEQAYIHSDRAFGAHTAIVYLSQHDQTYGTAFYKHKPSGWLAMPDPHVLMEECPQLWKKLKEDMVSRDPDKWEQVGFVEGKYNRALIFEAPLFHSRFPLDGIGNSPEDGRLIWASHFYKLDGRGELT